MSSVQSLKTFMDKPYEMEFIQTNRYRTEKVVGRVGKKFISVGTTRFTKDDRIREGFPVAAHRDGGGKKVTCFIHVLLKYLKFGVAPEGFVVDHIDQNKWNNKISNLRYVSQTVNNLNINKSNKNSVTGVRGVSMCKGRFKAQICKDKKVINLGVFDTIEEAEKAYLEKKSEFFKILT